MKENPNKQTIEELFTRGVGEFIDPDGSFRKKLETNPEKIVIKFGIDPTRPDIHLGHAVVLRKLRQLQDLGCKVIFLIGDYTAQIGDPSGKNKTRPEINMKEIISNANSYLEQVGVILDTSDKKKYELLLNSIWYQSTTDYPTGNMKEKAELWERDRKKYKSIRVDGQLPTVTLWNLMYTLRRITHAQLIERDMFQHRLKSGEQLYMHEMMYPILQGVDSNTIAGFFDSCDLEVGGTDQTFNMLIGRTIMKSNNFEPQSVLALQLLEGLDGKEKMSKSLDNYIGITDSPEDMFGKIMSIPDELITKYFLLCTDISMDLIEGYARDMVTGLVNPRDLKMILGKEIIEMYHSKKSADKAEENFIATFQNKEIPKDLEEIKVEKGALLADVFLQNSIVSSKTEFRRLVDENAITNLETNEKIISHTIEATDGVYRIGKKRFCKITIK